MGVRVDAARKIFGKALGKRPPWTEGRLDVPGINEPLTIRRDGWGVPHIDAATETDAWYGLGFCHGQDRAFQLETLLRVIRGTLSALDRQGRHQHRPDVPPHRLRA